jgi:hypothetical protein
MGDQPAVEANPAESRKSSLSLINGNDYLSPELPVVARRLFGFRMAFFNSRFV